jgi:predicted deacylase
MPTAEAFTYQGGRVDPGETQHLRYTITETYLGDPVRMPVTVVNGERPGPTAFLSAAAHGDELNGVEVVREVATEWDLADCCGTVVCMPVLNVPGFIAQQRYLPVYDRDLNRSFPGTPDSTSAKRMADAIFRNFVSPCDFGIDFHTSTRGRSNMLHVRANMTDDTAARVANAFASHVVIDKQGPSGTLRRAATEAGIPTITVEMGEAHRFQREFIDPALAGVRSVFAEFGLLDTETVAWPGWRTVVAGSAEKTWIRADAGGLVDMHADRGTLVDEGQTIATIGDPFGGTSTAVDAPFTGLLVGVAQNPLVYPGNPLCHLVRVDERTQRAIERNSD